MGRASLKNVIRLIDVAKKELPVEQEFLADLKRSIEFDAQREARKPSQTYKPSSMRCIRNMYYQLIGQEPDNVPSSYISVGITNSGSDIHLRVQTALMGMRANNINCDYIDVAEFVRSRDLDDINIVARSGAETKLYHKGMNMSFLCDGIIRYNNRYYIVEIKTETSNKFWKRNEVDAAHYNQATAYSIAFRLDGVLFIYISRDTLDMKSFLFTPTEEQKTALLNKLALCNSYVEKHELPPMPQDVEKKTCEYCNYRMSCRKEI